MDIKNTIISAEVVIESLITLLKNEDVDISSIQFSIGNKEKGTESEDMSFESLIYLTLSWLNEAKAHAVREGFVLVPIEPTEEILNTGRDFHINSQHSGFLNISELYKVMITSAQVPAHDSP